ncbi:MAG: hypothetical protein JKY56_14080, partial [Kofleriaceae bacterium]|nr:hypothetical protein [Kofleriaceae bacterium]
MSETKTISCYAPAKIMLAGEYAVVDGGPAILMAVDRAAVATLHRKTQYLSPFLLSAQRTIAQEFGQASQEVHNARRVSVCTDSFRHKGTKIGLGSSAAATVAAIGISITPADATVNQALVHRLAAKAHGDAQAKMGARGSGADIACASLGGVRLFQARSTRASDATPNHAGEEHQSSEGTQTTACQLPSDLHLVFPWTQKAAATAPMVRAVQEFKSRAENEYLQLAEAISAEAIALAFREYDDAGVVEKTLLHFSYYVGKYKARKSGGSFWSLDEYLNISRKE